MARIFLLSILAIAIYTAMPSTARADDAASQERRETFAKDFARIVVSVLQDQKKSFQDRKEVLREAFNKSVDVDWIAKFVLGKSWNQASDAQKERYTELYRKYLTETYVANFGDNPDKRISNITVFSVNNNTDTDFTVRTAMDLANQEHVKVNYLVREKDKKYKVVDIAIENVSLINTHRAEFTAIAAGKGIDGVIKTLEAALKQGKTSFTVSMN